jgi:anti-sigma-K factor RskA
MAHSERFEELAALQALELSLGDERTDFARHLQESCPVCEGLLVDFREASAALAALVPKVVPAPEVKERLMRTLGSGLAAPARPLTPSFARRLLAVAAVLLLAFVVTDDLRLRRQREELASRNTQLAGHLESARRDLARRDLRVRVLGSDDVQMLLLGGQDPQPAARARMFWSEKAKRGILVAGNLAPLPGDKQYELWVFSQGKPVPAGVFDSDEAGRALFESAELSAIPAAQNFAVTVEPRGGMPQPTGPIVLVGKPS